MTRYTSELRRVKNDKTGNYRYFAKVCGRFERIGAEDWDLKKDLAYDIENVTISTNGGCTRHDVTAVYYL